MLKLNYKLFPKMGLLNSSLAEILSKWDDLNDCGQSVGR